MTGDKVLTFRQYVDTRQRDAATRYDLQLAYVRREMPDALYEQEWRAYVVKTFDAGNNIPTRLWRSLDEGLRYRVLRSTRALRDDDLTRQLVLAAIGATR